MNKKGVIFLISLILLVTASLQGQNYNAIVFPGNSIQDAIEAAPQHPEKPYVILIKNGVYNETSIPKRKLHPSGRCSLIKLTRLLLSTSYPSGYSKSIA